MSLPIYTPASATLSPSHTPSAPPSTPLVNSSSVPGASDRSVDVSELIARRATLLFDGSAGRKTTAARSPSAPGSAPKLNRRGDPMPCQVSSQRRTATWQPSRSPSTNPPFQRREHTSAPLTSPPWT
ncbi:hypothetical protein M427DRAFT_333987 [Gonapodya prolifera JEL478]|uniref:Uncharacterized protein n=1 Tax=Gonapodya prolifera (strain JEL478) TaxID=1344416 RepID=A0A139ADY4_GONPJ|nr:hypothetical protein M427DRAFT_333987 [Gonapodya prolifera JEL478]|eukprot:KXS15036.1 hypothetical protein M427DRAFT_333987 [Gonapodya prolifera JEL478]